MAGSLDLELNVIVEAQPPDDLRIDRWDALGRHVLAHEGKTGEWSVAAVLVDDPRLQALHAQFMGIDEPTDVMTFPSGDPSSEGGDIVISVDRAREQAGDYGLTPAAEVEFLFVHGLLHLCGWDDASPVDRDRMIERGSALIGSFGE